jgi:hypothetical protein
MFKNLKSNEKLDGLEQYDLDLKSSNSVSSQSSLES